MISLNNLKPFGNGVTTDRFQSFAEKVTWHLRGHCKNAAGVRCSLSIYDEEGTETLLHSEDVPAKADGSICFSYSFDPISIAVYRNAVEFRAAVCPSAEGDELFLTEFCIEEKQAEIQNEAGEIICNLITDRDGKRAVSVMQPDGSDIAVPLVPKKVLFVGNSILLGIHNAYVMCASGPKKDYFYYVSEAIKEKNPDCEFFKLHGAGFEHAENEEMFEKWYSKELNT